MTDLTQHASAKGRAESKRDIAEKQLRLYVAAPDQAAWGRHLAETMLKRFAVQIVFASCLTDAEKTAYEKAYNDEVIGYIDRVFGVGAYSQAWDEVQCWRKARYDEWVTANRPDAGAWPAILR